MAESYVLKKEVDHSLLHEGITIPVNIQVVFQNNISRFLKAGESKDIKLLVEGKTYTVKLKNVNFDRGKYTRKDIIQIRYSYKSDIAVRLREIFRDAYLYFERERELRTDRKQIKLPEDKKEYIAVYTTEYPDTFILECLTNKELYDTSDQVSLINEEVFERELNYSLRDDTAYIDTVFKSTKVRRLNRAITNNLKMLYNYRCQICGDNFGSKYDANIVESHHIDPFVTSLNNNPDNQIIICPNHHRTIHTVNPTFDRQKKLFLYDNSYSEKVSLNMHL